MLLLPERASLDQYAVLVPIEVSDISFGLGYLLNFGLLGILTIQVFIYATRFRDDHQLLKIAVFVVFFLEVVNSVLVAYSMILGASIRCLSCLITGQRDYVVNGVLVSESLSTWAFQTLCVLTGLSSSMVQGFFAWRIWVLGRSIWIPIAVMVISLAQCILLMTGGILSSTDPNLGVYDRDGAVTWLIISTVCDILITIRTSQLLFRSYVGSQCRATQTLVRKLVRTTIETGLVTVVAMILEFILARTLGIAHHVVFYPLSKLYANCLLTTLNVRLTVHSIEKHHPTVAEPEDVSLSPAENAGRANHGLPTRKSVGVQMDHEGTSGYTRASGGSPEIQMISREIRVRTLPLAKTASRSTLSVVTRSDSDWVKGSLESESSV